jgi:hypothetical protein
MPEIRTTAEQWNREWHGQGWKAREIAAALQTVGFPVS